MRDKGRSRFPELSWGLCFALSFLAFMLTEALINERCAIILGSGAVNAVYALGLACTGAGFVSFPLLCWAWKGDKWEKAALLMIGALCLSAVVVLPFAERPALFLSCSAAALLLNGHIGGRVYYRTAMCFAGSPYTGRTLGAGMGAAILVQYAVQNLAKHWMVFTASIFLSLVVVLYLLLRVPQTLPQETPPPQPSSVRRGGETAAALGAAVVLMSLVAGMIDSVLTAFNAEKAYDIYSGVRLFYALGLVLAGFIADIRGRAYLPLATVCAMLLSTLCMFFMSEELSYFAGTALMYLYSGFYVIFFTVMFLDHAPKSGCPQLWAGLGRCLRSFTVAATVLPALRIYDAAGGTVLAVGSCLISIGILLVLLPYVGRAVKAPEQGRESSARERLMLYARHSSLTPRETEVLEKLLTTDKDLQGIADSMYISRRMVQRYVSSIYEKTETKTRLGLFQSYINFTAD